MTPQFKILLLRRCASDLRDIAAAKDYRDLLTLSERYDRLAAYIEKAEHI